MYITDVYEAFHQNCGFAIHEALFLNWEISDLWAKSSEPLVRVNLAI